MEGASIPHVGPYCYKKLILSNDESNCQIHILPVMMVLIKISGRRWMVLCELTSWNFGRAIV